MFFLCLMLLYVCTCASVQLLLTFMQFSVTEQMRLALILGP